MKYNTLAHTHIYTYATRHGQTHANTVRVLFGKHSPSLAVAALFAVSFRYTRVTHLLTKGGAERASLANECRLLCQRLHTAAPLRRNCERTKRIHRRLQNIIPFAFTQRYAATRFGGSGNRRNGGLRDTLVRTLRRRVTHESILRRPRQCYGSGIVWRTSPTRAWTERQ